jgi:hypothetical protein
MLLHQRGIKRFFLQESHKPSAGFVVSHAAGYQRIHARLTEVISNIHRCTAGQRAFRQRIPEHLSITNDLCGHISPENKKQ